MLASRASIVVELVIATAALLALAIGSAPLPAIPMPLLYPPAAPINVVHVERASPPRHVATAAVPRRPSVRDHWDTPACKQPLSPEVERLYRARKFAEAADALEACGYKAAIMRELDEDYRDVLDETLNLGMRWTASTRIEALDAAFGGRYIARVRAVETRIAPQVAQLWIKRRHVDHARRFIQSAIERGLSSPALVAIERRLEQ